MDTELRRFESYFFKPLSPGNSTPVALAGATIVQPTRAGATVAEIVEFFEQDTHDLLVNDAGLIRVGDTLFLELEESVQLQVLAVSADRRTLTLQNMADYVVPAIGQRLRPINDLPGLFRDPRGLLPYGTTPPTLDSVGYVYFYSPTTLVDFQLTGGGLSAPQLHINRRCGWERGADTWRNARDFASIQDAIDSLPDVGGTVFIPAGLYDLDHTLYTPCDRPCHLLGEGSSRSGTQGTVLRFSSNTGMLRVRGNYSSVRGLTLRMMASGVAASEHEGCGIFVGRRNIVDAHPHPGTSATATEYDKTGRTPLYRLVLDDIVVLDSPGWGLSIPGFGTQSDGAPEYASALPSLTDGGTLSFWIDISRVELVRARKYGALFTGGGCTTLHFSSGVCQSQGEGETIELACYAHLRGTVQAVFRDWIFEGCSPVGDATGLTKPWVSLVGCESSSFETCWFENDNHFNALSQPIDYHPQYFLHLSGMNRSITLRQMHFVRGGKNRSALRCVYCTDDGVDGLYIDQPYAISATVLTQLQGANHYVPIDTRAFVLNGETNPTSGTRNIFVRAGGIATDASGASIPSDLLRIPLTYESIPISASLTHRQTLRAPLSTMDERTNGRPDTDAMLAQSGAMAMEELVPGSLNSRALLFCSGGETKWRLANNLPSLSATQRDARSGWVTGDLILNTDYPRIEVFDGTGWRSVGVPLPDPE